MYLSDFVSFHKKKNL